MSSLKILYLEAQEADAESIGSIVNIVREVQSGRTVTSVQSLTAPLRLAAPAEETSAPPLALPASKAPRQAREPKPQQRVSKGKRATGLTPAIKAAVAASGGDKPDYNAIAKEVYGNAGADSITKVRRAFWSLCERGTLKKLGEDSYKVIG